MRGSRGGEIGLWWILRRDLVVQDFGSAGDWNDPNMGMKIGWVGEGGYDQEGIGHRMGPCDSMINHFGRW